MSNFENELRKVVASHDSKAIYQFHFKVLHQEPKMPDETLDSLAGGIYRKVDPTIEDAEVALKYAQIEGLREDTINKLYNFAEKVCVNEQIIVENKGSMKR